MDSMSSTLPAVKLISLRADLVDAFTKYSDLSIKNMDSAASAGTLLGLRGIGIL